MIDDIMENICCDMSKKIKLTKGTVVLLTAAAFAAGILVGACTMGLKLGKTIRKLRKKSMDDDFDADEYVRNLNFDDDCQI